MSAGSREGPLTHLVATCRAVVAALGRCSRPRCGGGESKAATPKTTTTTTSAPTTTTVAPPIAPLTGLPDPGGASHGRPALSVKVENTDAARPQTGIDQADVVYEEVVEGDITRLRRDLQLARCPTVIGPVRSVRSEDPDIVWPVGGIFAYSGGAPVNVDAINAAPVHAVDEDARRRRDVPQRARPAAARRAAQPLRARPAAVRPRRRPDAAAGAVPVPAPTARRRRRAAASIDFHVGFHAGLRPDVDLGRRHRHVGAHRSSGVPQTVVGGAPIAPTNVVVQFTHVHRRGRGADRRRGRRLGVHRRRACARAGGCGPTRPSRRSTSTPPATRSCCGPGRTWVELLPAGSPVDVTPAPPPRDHAAAGDHRTTDHGQEEEVAASVHAGSQATGAQ